MASQQGMRKLCLRPLSKCPILTELPSSRQASFLRLAEEDDHPPQFLDQRFGFFVQSLKESC